MEFMKYDLVIQHLPLICLEVSSFDIIIPLFSELELTRP